MKVIPDLEEEVLFGGGEGCRVHISVLLISTAEHEKLLRKVLVRRVLAAAHAVRVRAVRAGRDLLRPALETGWQRRCVPPWLERPVTGITDRFRDLPTPLTGVLG